MKVLIKISLILIIFVQVSISYSQPRTGSTNNAANNNTSNITAPRDGVFDRIHTEMKKPVPYSHVRQADVIYSKRVWQLIDFRKKINQAFYYPLNDHTHWKNFITVILNAIQVGDPEYGTLTAYHSLVDGKPDDEFTSPMNPKQIEELLQGPIEKVAQRDLNGNLLDSVLTYPEKFNKADVKKLRIKEVWYFDKQRSQLRVRILGLCPVWEYTTPQGEYKTKPLFWIYFPEARKYLARAEVFNRQNGAERRTYEDVFWKRMFSSYIYKAENVYDRNIKQYATGMDALLESERIKRELFEVEQEMWEY